MNKAENGVAILSGVTVVTVTLSHPQTPLLKLLMKIRDIGQRPISLILTKAQSEI